MHERLKLLKLFLDFYFSPWGAAKTAIWEHISSQPFNDWNAHVICIQLTCDDPETSQRVAEALDAERK